MNAKKIETENEYHEYPTEFSSIHFRPIMTDRQFLILQILCACFFYYIVIYLLFRILRYAYDRIWKRKIHGEKLWEINMHEIDWYVVCRVWTRRLHSRNKLAYAIVKSFREAKNLVRMQIWSDVKFFKYILFSSVKNKRIHSSASATGNVHTKYYSTFGYNSDLLNDSMFTDTHKHWFPSNKLIN